MRTIAPPADIFQSLPLFVWAARHRMTPFRIWTVDANLSVEVKHGR